MQTPSGASAVKLTRDLFKSFETTGQESDDKDVFVIQDYKKWEETQRLCQRERKVIALEITNHFNESCARVRPLFDHLAKEFPSACVRVITGPFPLFVTLDRVCQGVGRVSELPAILLLFYDEPNHIKRKTYAGEVAIQRALRNGQLKRQLKEFIDDRLQQQQQKKLTESLRAADLAYETNLQKMSRSLSQDELVKRAQSREGHETVNVPCTVPEAAESETFQEDEENDTDSKNNTSSTKEGPISQKGTDDDMDNASSENTPVRDKPRPQSASCHNIERSQIDVGERIGQGGFGTVFKAKWVNKTVAVKSCDGDLLEHGAAEVKILASLPQHPNVLRFFGVSVSPDKINTLIVTEFAFNGSLYNALHGKNREEPTAEQAMTWSFQIASGMAHLHRHNVIHRDLKSHNVLLSYGYAKLCDFGTARELSKTCRPTGTAGTYRWMAPEVAGEVEHTINNKCDVFSYGMILYEIFALEVPFSEIKSDLRVCYLLMEGKRPPIPEKLPSFLHPLITDCWSHDPAQRPSFQRIVTAIQTEVYEEDDTDA